MKACRPERDTDLLDAMFLKKPETRLCRRIQACSKTGLQFAGPEGFPVHPTKTAPAGLDATSLESSAVTKAEEKKTSGMLRCASKLALQIHVQCRSRLGNYFLTLMAVVLPGTK